MNAEIESWEFTVPLALEAHYRAKQFCNYQSNSAKAKQIYLNALAVYAVNFYLQCRGFETDLERSGSNNSAMQMFVNIADLIVKNRGKLECRPVLPNAVSMHVPLEVWNDRIGYVAVQLNESLREATVLGFVDRVKRSEFPLSQLRSLAEFPAYLNKMTLLVHLSQWFENIVEAGWQTIESLTQEKTTELAFSFRNKPEVKRYKLIELGETETSVAMVVSLIQESAPEIEISVEIQPSPSHTYLPDYLELMVLDEAGEVVIDAHTRSDNKSIQLAFTGESGDRFSVKLVLGNINVTENFLI